MTDVNDIKMWACKKYPSLSVMATTAEAFCAKRFEAAHGAAHAAAYSYCANCNRGAIQFDLGKHESKGQGARVMGQGETKQAKTETIQPKGETNMPHQKTISKKCETHGEYFTKRTNGRCPQCVAAIGKKPPRPDKPVKRSKKGNGKDVALSTQHSALSTQHSAHHHPYRQRRLVEISQAA